MENEEQQAIDELMAMSEKELEQVEHNKVKWVCCCKGCSRITHIKDYGIYPLFRWRKKWIDLSKIIFYCGKHYPIFRRKPALIEYKPYNEINIINYEDTKESNN
jgi:hypothetical protein